MLYKLHLFWNLFTILNDSALKTDWHESFSGTGVDEGGKIDVVHAESFAVVGRQGDLKGITNESLLKNTVFKKNCPLAAVEKRKNNGNECFYHT
jgi:hypothetical protein